MHVPSSDHLVFMLIFRLATVHFLVLEWSNTKQSLGRQYIHSFAPVGGTAGETLGQMHLSTCILINTATVILMTKAAASYALSLRFLATASVSSRRLGAAPSPAARA